MLSLKGLATSKFEPFIGIVTHGPKSLFSRKNYVLVSNKIGINSIGYLGAISSSKVKDCFYIPDCVCEVNNIDALNVGDLVSVAPDGKILVVWTKDSTQNVLFLTEACNCRCLVCPQPPKKHEPKLVKNAERILDLIYGQHIGDICISGGEPSILMDKFLHILRRCVIEHPEAQVDILTNGKLFSKKNYANIVSSIVSDDVVFCVSLHSDVAEVHDRIVGKKGSFIQTVNGIYNLAENNCSIEIRIVINKLNYKDLSRMALHLANYFPFCVHYAFMGMEVHGLAEENFEEINSFPTDYFETLKDAVVIMKRRGLNVSVYNVPLCMCHEDIRNFAKKSISDWKNIYRNECGECSLKGNCCGFFGTSSKLPVKYIKPIA